MFQSQAQQQQEHQHGNTAGTPGSEWASDYTQLRMKHNEHNTELIKFSSNKYGSGGNNDKHEVQTGAASGLPSQKREPWSDKERELFVIGLHTYGKGRWKEISENVLPSKTPSQIASHAQKYFLRQGSQNKIKRRRRSIHDHAMPHVVHTHVPPLPPPRNCYDVAAPPQDQLQQPEVHAEKESDDQIPWDDLQELPQQTFWDQTFLG